MMDDKLRQHGDARIRDASLKAIGETLHAMYGEGDLSTGELRSLHTTFERLKQEYLDSLPRVPVAKCPYCETLCLRTVDDFGLDGLWWDVNGPDQPVKACHHHLVTMGALNLNGHQPCETDVDWIISIEPGPEVPYVIPDLLKSPETSCVLRDWPIADGRYRAFLMSYFSQSPDALNRPLPAPWPRRTLASRHNGGWDYDLRTWLEGTESHPELVAWIEPNDTSCRLVWGSTEDCPFVDLDGNLSPQRILHGRVVVVET